ncbi:dihydroxyacetone phosphate acyltransferase [Papilio machaon]|uniref:dihydroxyacetone phosphate acyltransferase n=1 Tax=Papilio machaon TaxID=76193 RepID=UPI001E663AE6|nr:dihydroxyacetone phosphate acyltransferase [Papilio machaon]
MIEKVQFVDIIEPRNTHFGIFKFMTRPWYPKKSLIMDTSFTPAEIKKIVASSTYIDSFIEAESIRSGVPKEQLMKQVREYLEEMGMDKKMHVIRWMGIVFLKISFMMKIGIFVNETAILKLKEQMGKNPILFLPTHRSYADFCVLTYLCYHYDIELPAVAAGMDFYSMAVVGQRMRETGAFYMRRTIVGAPLYAATLKQYVRTLVAKYHAPLEFFIEGTRSRSNKSLPPKYGMMSMSLTAYFAGEVSDITIVPVNFSYDRIMEQTLFAYEHIGVPKPKESTGGLLKALRSLNDHFGNIYVNFGTQISVKEFLKNTNLVTNESLKPASLQQLTPEQSSQVRDIADEVVVLQQNSAVATITNLLALVLMDSLMKCKALDYEELLLEVDWMMEVLRGLGASVYEKDIKKSVDRILVVHHKTVTLDRERRLRLLTGDLMEVSSDVTAKMKGHILKAETMMTAVPVIQLQIYINPMLHYILTPALVYVLVKRGSTNKDKLAIDYYRLRKLLKHEFFYVERTEKDILNKAIDYCTQQHIIINDEGTLRTGDVHRLQYLLEWALLPFLTTLMLCIDVTIEMRRCEHKKVLKCVQERAEREEQHPYCLSLESAANCLQGLLATGALLRHKTDSDSVYEVVPAAMESCRQLVSSVLPKLNSVWGRNNPVFELRAPLASRL